MRSVLPSRGGGHCYRGSRAALKARSTSISSLSKSTRMTLKWESPVRACSAAMSARNCATQRAWFFTGGRWCHRVHPKLALRSPSTASGAPVLPRLARRAPGTPPHIPGAWAHRTPAHLAR